MLLVSFQYHRVLPKSRSHGNENYEAPSVFVGSAEFWFAVVVHGPRIPKDHATFWTWHLDLRTPLAFKPLFLGFIKIYKIRPGFSADICNSWEFLQERTVVVVRIFQHPETVVCVCGLLQVYSALEGVQALPPGALVQMKPILFRLRIIFTPLNKMYILVGIINFFLQSSRK